ncbi:MAG: hypothetical protein QM726_04835 [Chitinophagaceae bacterium]
MKWIQVSNPGSEVHVFQLLEGNAVKEVLRYNPSQNSVRVSCMGKQRLFFIEQTGFGHSRYNFKNEYGFNIGRLLVENHTEEGGSIEIEEKKLHYRLHTSPTEQLSIYEHDRVQPLASCSFSKNTGGDKNQNTIATGVQEYASLLLGLCWYLFNPLLQQNNTISAPVLAFA